MSGERGNETGHGESPVADAASGRAADVAAAGGPDSVNPAAANDVGRCGRSGSGRTSMQCGALRRFRGLWKTSSTRPNYGQRPLEYDTRPGGSIQQAVPQYAAVNGSLGRMPHDRNRSEKTKTNPPQIPCWRRRYRRRHDRHAAGLARADRDPEDAGLVGRQGRLQRDGARLRQARQRHGRRPAQDRLSGRRRGRASVPGARRRAWRPDRRRPYRDRLLVRQAQGRLAVRHRPGVRLQRQRGSRLDPQRRRPGAVRRAPDPDHEGQHQELLRHADADPAARLVQEADHQRRRPQGPEVPHRRPRGRPVPGDGRSRWRSFRAAKSCRPWSAA